jgi:hypothetical protein
LPSAGGSALQAENAATGADSSPRAQRPPERQRAAGLHHACSAESVSEARRVLRHHDHRVAAARFAEGPLIDDAAQVCATPGCAPCRDAGARPRVAAPRRRSRSRGRPPARGRLTPERRLPHARPIGSVACDVHGVGGTSPPKLQMNHTPPAARVSAPSWSVRSSDWCVCSARARRAVAHDDPGRLSRRPSAAWRPSPCRMFQASPLRLSTNSGTGSGVHAHDQ